MYHCKGCNIKFEKLLQIPKEDKMIQCCPNCKSENIDLLSNLSEAEKMRFIRENKLDRITKDKPVTKKTFLEPE